MAFQVLKYKGSCGRVRLQLYIPKGPRPEPLGGARGHANFLKISLSEMHFPACPYFANKNCE